MSALRKFKAPVAPNAGHRWHYLLKVFEERPHLSPDARLVLTVLFGHDNEDRIVNPGIRRIAKLCGISHGRSMAARDELTAEELIECDVGSGTRPSVYYLVDLNAWFARWVEARSSVPDSAPSVPDSASSVHTAGTNPSEPSEPEKEAPPEPKVVKMGWEGLKERATPDQRLWLDCFVVDKVEGGCTFLTATNPAAPNRAREMLRQDLREIAEKLGVGPDRVKMRILASSPAPDLPPTMPITPKGGDEFADRLEEKTDTVTPPKPVFDGKTVDLAAYRTRKDDPYRESDDGSDDQR